MWRTLNGNTNQLKYLTFSLFYLCSTEKFKIEFNSRIKSLSRNFMNSDKK